MDDIVKHKDAEGIQGDLARELLSIINDYRHGQLTLEEKEELVQDVIKIYSEASHAQDEVTVRWIASVGSVALSVI
jgi:hypothetical protein